jgi:hypothetical protein
MLINIFKILEHFKKKHTLHQGRWRTGAWAGRSGWRNRIGPAADELA